MTVLTMLNTRAVQRLRCAVLSLLLLSAGSLVQADQGLASYPLAEQEMTKSSTESQHLLATGRIQNKNGEPFPETWLNLPGGTLNQAMYRIRSTRDTDDILEHYQKQLQQPGREILFECSGRECGSSSDWANRVFKVSTLYGVDRKQHYIAGRKEDGDWSDYISVYITERGTGRIYAYVQHYRVKAEEFDQKGVQKTLFQQLTETGWVRLPATADGQIEEGANSTLQALVKQLQNSNDRYWLIAHHYGKGNSQETLQEKSEKAAKRLLKSLQSLGLSENKASAKGLGGLAPTKDSVVYGGRIELLIQQ